MSGSVHIRRAESFDSAAVAALHLRQIPWGLLTQLGEDFVTAFYRALLTSPLGFVFLVVREGQPVGFASGVENWRRFYLEFLRRHLRLAVRVVAANFRRARWQRLLETTRYAASGTLPRAELVSIALDPEARGAGLAGRLVQCVLDEFAARRVGNVRVTAGGTNLPARQLYERMGFALHSEAEIHPGEVAAVYVIAVGRPTPAAAVRGT